jgi:hypothetical protein
MILNRKFLLDLPKPRPKAQFDANGLGYNSLDHLYSLDGYPENGTKCRRIEGRAGIPIHDEVLKYINE